MIRQTRTKIDNRQTRTEIDNVNRQARSEVDNVIRQTRSELDNVIRQTRSMSPTARIDSWCVESDDESMSEFGGGRKRKAGKATYGGLERA